MRETAEIVIEVLQGCGLLGLLIFLLWHAIFVDRTVVPTISEPQYPVQL